MSPLSTIFTLIALGALMNCSAFAEGLTFGLVGKSIDDANFIAAWRGCDTEAKRFGDKCILVGGKGAADPRLQLQAIESALKANRLAALAISVTNSELIAKTVETAGVPIVTFDSPFSAKYEHLSLAYIGADNVKFGHDLAKIAKRLRPQGGTVCLMTAYDPNLAQRVQGVRQELSGNSQFPEGQRLNGEGGWTEIARSPWNCGDSVERTIKELAVTLKHLKPDVFISVGQWPVVDPAAYRKTVEPFRLELIAKERIMIVATGAIAPGQAALLDEKLVHGYVSLSYREIGRRCYTLMRAAAEGKPIPLVTYTDNTIQIGE